MMAAWLLLLAIQASAAAEPAVAFLNREAATEVVTDESIEPYFKNMQAREMLAKTGQAFDVEDLPAMRDITRERYGQATLDFTDDERAMLKDGVTRVHELTETDYPRFAAQPWKFIKLHHKIEGGLPHTRNDCIVLSDNVLKQLAFMHSQDAEAASQIVAQLLIHEQIHVMQRMHPTLFKSLYEDVWGFQYVRHIVKNEDLLKRQILNPDGVDTDWIFPIGKDEHTRWIQPNIILADGEGVPNMPRDFRMVAIELIQVNAKWQPKLDDNAKPIIHPLNQFVDYREALGGGGNNYHPNEALAAIFPKLVTWDMAKVEQGVFLAKTEGLLKVETWAKEAFAAENSE